MFTLGNWIGIGLVVVCCIVATIVAYLCWKDGWGNDAKEKAKKKAKKNTVILVLIEIILIAVLMFGCGFYNTHTESGKRSLKTWDSEKSGGLQRTVTVFDMQGEEVAKYEGKFDVEESQSNGVVKVKFDINGKRHIIYAQTGTVLIDEN